LTLPRLKRGGFLVQPGGLPLTIAGEVVEVPCPQAFTGRTRRFPSARRYRPMLSARCCRVDGQRGSVPRPFLSVPLRTWACCFHSTRLSSHTHFTSEASSQVVPYGYSCDTTSTRRGFSACGLTSLLPTVVFLAFLSAQGLSVLGY